MHVLDEGSVTSGWCRDEFGITYDTAVRDLNGLCQLAVLVRRGKGRSTHYVLAARTED